MAFMDQVLDPGYGPQDFLHTTANILIKHKSEVNISD